MGFGRPQDWLDLNPQGSKKVRRSPADMGNIPLFTGFYTSQVVRELLVLEILHQLMCGLSHYLQGLGYIPGGCLGFLPSTVAPENVWLEGKPFLLGRPIFGGYVSFREGTLPNKKTKKTPGNDHISHLRKRNIIFRMAYNGNLCTFPFIPV